MLNKAIIYAYQRKQKEIKEKHTFRVVDAIRSVNQIIIKEDDINNLCSNIAQSLVEKNGYEYVWIYVNQLEKVFYFSSFNKNEILNELFIQVKNNNLPACLKYVSETEKFFSSHQYASICNDCYFFSEPKNQTSFVKQIKYRNNSLGYISVGVNIKYADNKTEQDLFVEVANDLGYAINSLNQKKQKEIHEKSLEVSKKHFQSLLNNPVNYAIYRLKGGKNAMDGKITHISPSLADIAGIEPADIMDFQKWFKYIVPEDINKIIKANEKGTKPPFEFNEVLRIEHPQKGRRWLNVMAKGFAKETSPDKLFYANGIITDITEIKKAEEQLTEQNLKHQKLLEEFKTQNKILEELNEKTEKLLANNIIQKQEIQKNNMRLKALSEINYYNPENIQDLLEFSLTKAIELTESKIGYIYFYDNKKSQFILNSWSKRVMKECEVVVPKTVYELDKTGIWGEAVRQQKPIIINDYDAPNEYKKGTPQGHVKLKKFLTVPVFSNDEIKAVVGVANKETDYDKTDVLQLNLLMENVWKSVERYKLIEDLEKAKIKAEESDKLKTVFLSNMSHEIRTPMNAILGFSDIIENNDVDEQKQKYYLNIIKKSAVQLLNIIDDIIDVSKIESNQLSTYKEHFNPKNVITEVYEVFKYSNLIKEGVNLYHSVEHFNDEISLFSDPKRIKQVLTNLISNSIKYTSKGEIVFGYEIKNEKIVFYVKDTGVGIPKEKQKVIFDRFRQVNEFDYHEGTGLGLSISKGIVEKLNGEIRLESEVGKGSAFYFSFNLDFKKQTTENNNSEKVLDADKEFDLSEKSVFIVDDEEYAVFYLMELLEPTNANIFILRDGEELMNELEIIVPDLILLDINMPKKTGLECIKEIREKNIETKVIAQTAFAMNNERNICENVGFDDYIAKPIAEDELLIKIKKVLNL